MAKGRPKGYKKALLEIRDEIISPYHIIQDDKQFIVHKEGSIFAEGYYTSLSSAIEKVIRLQMVLKNAGEVVTLQEYLNRYQTLVAQVQTLVPA